MTVTSTNTGDTEATPRQRDTVTGGLGMPNTTNRPDTPGLPVPPVALGVDRTVPVRPLALGAANVAVLAGATAFAIAGTGGLAAAAGAMAVGTAAMVGRARRRRQSTGTVFGPTGSRRSGGRWSMPSFRPGRGLFTGGRSTAGGGGRRRGTVGSLPTGSPSVSPTTRTRSAAPSGSPTGRGTARGTAPVPRPGSRPVPTGTTRSTTSPAPRRSTTPAGGDRQATPGTSAWRMARRAGQTAVRAARATRDGVRDSYDPRIAAAAARARIQARHDDARWVRVVTGWVAASIAYLGAAIRNALLLVFGTDVPHASVVPAGAQAPPPTAKVGNTLRAQSANTTTPGETPMGNTANDASALNPLPAMIDAAEDLLLLLGRFDPDGMVPVRDAYQLLPEFLDLVAKMMRTLGERANGRYPLDPQILDLIDGLHTHAVALATTSEHIGPMITVLHQDRFDDLEDERNAMWDHRANQEA